MISVAEALATVMVTCLYKAGVKAMRMVP